MGWRTPRTRAICNFLNELIKLSRECIIRNKSMFWLSNSINDLINIIWLAIFHPTKRINMIDITTMITLLVFDNSKVAGGGFDPRCLRWKQQEVLANWATKKRESSYYSFSRIVITLLVTTSTLTTKTLKTTTTTGTNKRQILETKAKNSNERTLEPCPKDEHNKR